MVPSNYLFSNSECEGNHPLSGKPFWLKPHRVWTAKCGHGEETREDCPCGQGAGDQRLHRSSSQAHAEDLLQEESTSSCASGEAICLQGHVDEGRAHRHEVEQVPLEQRCPQCASACARALVPEAQRGWGCEGEDVYIGPTCAGRKLQGSSDRDGQRWLRWLRWGETAVRKAVVRQGSWVGNPGNLKNKIFKNKKSFPFWKLPYNIILTSLRAEGTLYG